MFEGIQKKLDSCFCVCFGEVIEHGGNFWYTSRYFTLRMKGCDHQRVVFACVCVCDRGGRLGWMSHIVPVRPTDIAGGQRGMEPERGDSDK